MNIKPAGRADDPYGTSVLIDLFKGDQNKHVSCLKEIINRQMPFGITYIICQKLLQGVKNKKEYALLDEYLNCQRFFHSKDPVLKYGKAAFPAGKKASLNNTLAI